MDRILYALKIISLQVTKMYGNDGMFYEDTII